MRHSVFYGGFPVKITAAALLLFTLPASAADKALVLNDGQQAALKQTLDAAIRANGLSTTSRNALILSDMLDAAPVVTARTDDKPKEDKPKPAEESPQ